MSVTRYPIRFVIEAFFDKTIGRKRHKQIKSSKKGNKQAEA